MSYSNSWIDRKMATTTNPETLKLLETISHMDDTYLDMSAQFEWEMASRDFRNQMSNICLSPYDKEVRKLGKAMDEFLYQEWFSNLTPKHKEAVEWATRKFKLTGDTSFEIIAEDPQYATIVYENNWATHAKPFFEGFDALPLTYFELAIDNLSSDLEEFILDNTHTDQTSPTESWDSLTSSSESDDELVTPIGSIDIEPTPPTESPTLTENAHTLTTTKQVPNPRSNTISFTPPREMPQLKGKHHLFLHIHHFTPTQPTDRDTNDRRNINPLH